MSTDEVKYGNFRKDYSWQERAIEAFMTDRAKFYSLAPGQFERAYVVEVSPSGGKTIFSMKLASRLIRENLIDKVIWCVPRDSIKLGFKDDASHVEMPKEHRLIGDQYFRVDTALRTDYNGLLRNCHGAVIAYQSLPQMLDYFELLGRKHRLLFVLDEAHHGSVGETDEAQNIWGSAMEQCRSRAHAIVCMTGTPIRSDSKKIPYLTYDAEQSPDGRVGWRVRSDFSFSYQDAVIAGIARKILCRSQDPEITYQVIDQDTGEIAEYSKPVSFIPSTHLARVKNTAFCFSRGIIDDLLRIAYQECQLMRKTGDPDAAILVIARRDLGDSDTRALIEIKGRIRALFGEHAVTVESADADARQAIAAFKRGTDQFIVAKEMISEGTNIPRIRIILILRDIGNRTFYEQLVHRATRNDADDRPQDAIIIQLKFPNLHDWCSDLETQARIAWEKKTKSMESDASPSAPKPSPLIEGICARSDKEAVVIEGEDFTEVDPVGRKLHAEIGESTKTSRWQLDKILKALPNIGVSLPESTVQQNEVFSIDQQIAAYLELGKKDCKRAAQNLGGDNDTFMKVTAEAKRAAGIKGKLPDLARDHPHPLDAAKRFAEAARRAAVRSRRPDESQGNLL